MNQYISNYLEVYISYIVTLVDNQTYLISVATLGILSRVFLFHFEKISGNFSLFWDVLVNTG